MSETASAGAKKNSEEIKKLKGCSKVVRNKEIYIMMIMIEYYIQQIN